MERPKSLSTRIKALFGNVDPFVEPLPDDHSRRGTNLPFTLLYAACIIAYSAFVFHQFFNREPTLTFSFVPTAGMGAVPVDIVLACSASEVDGSINHKTGCYKKVNDSYTGEVLEYVHVVQHYADNLQCDGLKSRHLDRAVTTEHSRAAFRGEFQLCFSADYYGDGIDVKIPWFDNWKGEQWSSLTVNVTAGEGYGSMFVSMQIGHWERKTVFLSVIENKNDDAGVDTKELSVEDLFYDGKNPVPTAMLRLRMRQFSSLYESQKQGTVLDVLGAIGGAAGLCMSILMVVKAVVDFFAQRCGKKVAHAEDGQRPQHSHSNGGGAKAMKMERAA